MQESFITDEGAEVVMLPRRRSQSVLRLGGSHEVFDFNTFDFHLLKPIEDLSLQGNRITRNAHLLFQAFRYFLSVVTLTIIASEAARRADQSIIDRLGKSVFLSLGYIVQFSPIPFLYVVVLHFNNTFAETMYYKYLQCGGIIDFPDSSKRSFFTSHFLPLLFLCAMALYTCVLVVVLFLFRAPLSNFVVALSSIVAMVSYWFSHQGIEDKLISLSDYIQSFPDASGTYGNIDRFSLAAASEALKSLVLLEGRVPSYDSFWRRQFIKFSVTSRGWRTWVSFAVKVAITLVVAVVALYAFFLLSLSEESSWQSVVNPCIRACVYDPLAGYYESSRCSGCTCRCLLELQYRTCDCSVHMYAPNCSSAVSCQCSTAAVQCF